MPLPRKQKEKKVPELPELLDKRDWTGAATHIEFERKVFMENKRASGWKAGPSGEYEWVEGGSAQLTDEERTNDATRGMWLAYCYTHLGQHKKALDTYQALLDGGATDPMIYLYQGCCLLGMGWFSDAEEKALKGPACALQNRLLFHISHRLNDENKLMGFHQKLQDSTTDQLSLASIHYLRNHYQEATDIYKRMLLENRDFTALNVFVALCYYKLDYYDVSLEILAAYLQARNCRAIRRNPVQILLRNSLTPRALAAYLQANPDSAVALNLKACNQFKLYDGKAAEAELSPLTKDAPSPEKVQSPLVRHNMVVFSNGERALQASAQFGAILAQFGAILAQLV